MTCAFSSSLTTTVFSQRSMRWFDASPRRATPKGHNLHHLHSTASRRPPYIGLLSALMAHPNPQKAPTSPTASHDTPRAATPARRIPGLLQQHSPPPSTATPHTHRSVQRPAQGLAHRLPDPAALPPPARQNRRRRRDHRPPQQPPTPHRIGQEATRYQSDHPHRRPRHPRLRPPHRPTHPQTHIRPHPRLPTTPVNDVPRHDSVGLTGFEPATTWPPVNSGNALSQVASRLPACGSRALRSQTRRSFSRAHTVWSPAGPPPESLDWHESGRAIREIAAEHGNPARTRRRTTSSR